MYITQIRNGLKGVKADADGQRNAEQRKVRAEKRVDIRNKEVGILEEAKCADARDYGSPKKYLRESLSAELVNEKTVDIAGNNRRDHQEGVYRLAVEIEQEARYKEHYVLELKRYYKVYNQYRYKEII